MEDETRDAALERLDVQMAYLRERIEEMLDQIQAAEAEGERLGSHLYEQYELLTNMYLQRLVGLETLKLERETEIRLGRR